MSARSLAALVPLMLLASGCSSKREAGNDEPTSTPTTPIAVRADATAPVEVTEVTGDATGTRIGLSLLGRYKDPVFGGEGLPAVSTDGTRVAYGEERLDGGRGNPNFRLVIREVKTDKPVVAKEILPPSPRWKADDEAIVRGRIDEANQLLEASQWTPMKVMDGGNEALGTLAVGDHEVVIRGNQLVVLRAGRARLRRPLAGLLKTDGGCPGKVSLAEAYIGDSALLVRFMFETDGCWREAELHVLSLGR